MQVRVLSGGAANGLVQRIAPDFTSETGFSINGDYGAVGGMRDRILGGEDVDLIILTRALIEALCESGHADPSTIADLGAVVTGVAVRTGDPHPDISTAEGIRDAMAAADEVYTSDTTRATAGIHFAKTLDTLGLTDLLAPRMRGFPSGNIAMAALAKSTAARPIGCTQITEILPTEGIDYIGDLPPGFELTTVYSAAVSSKAANRDGALELLARLTDPNAAAIRKAAGFTN